MSDLARCEKCGAVYDPADTVTIGHYAPACAARLLARVTKLETLAQRVLDTEGAGTAAPQPTADDAGAFYRALQDLRSAMRKPE